jgi:hypothetical protein
MNIPLCDLFSVYYFLCLMISLHMTYGCDLLVELTVLKM